VVEQKLSVMYLEHRMRTFQGTFHASPDDALWYGWSEMQRDLTEIKELAAQMRREKLGATLKPGSNSLSRHAQPAIDSMALTTSAGSFSSRLARSCFMCSALVVPVSGSISTACAKLNTI
jgi:hypothetical protein